MLEKIVEKVKNNVPLPAFIIFVCTAVSAVLHIAFVKLPAFADFFNRYISSVFRTILAKLTTWFPFSLAEAFIIFIPVTFVTVIIWAFRRVKLSVNAGNRSVVSLISVIAFLYSVFVLNFAAGYSTSPLETKLSLERKDLSADDLRYAADYLISEMNSLDDKIKFDYASLSEMPYSNSEMIDKLNDAYEKAYDKYAFIAPLRASVKQVALSELMTYTHISGVYSFFTGEANINMNFPDYTIPYTTAHEMAHQRGVIREDEANFMAFLVCLESDDPYIRYSALLNMYEYVASALYSADSEKYYDTVSGLDLQVRYEMQAYREFYEKYQHTVVSNVSDSMNDFYLKSQGQAAGSRSYGQVVDLAVAYFREMTESESK